MDRTYEKESTEWIEFVAALEEIKSISDARKLPTPLFVPLFQGSGDFKKPTQHLEYILKWCRQAGEAAGEVGFVVVDMEDEFMAQGDQNRHVNPWDGHPNAECNEVYARHIADVVAKLLNDKKSE